VTARKQADRPAAAAEQATSFPAFVHDVLEDKRVQDIVWLDVRGVTDMADEFLIGTIQTQRQGAAVVDACEQERKRRGIPCIGIEGKGGSSWVLLDYGSLIVHLFLPEQRHYYALEHVWADAKRLK